MSLSDATEAGPPAHRLRRVAAAVLARLLLNGQPMLGALLRRAGDRSFRLHPAPKLVAPVAGVRAGADRFRPGG